MASASGDPGAAPAGAPPPRPRAAAPRHRRRPGARRRRRDGVLRPARRCSSAGLGRRRGHRARPGAAPRGGAAVSTIYADACVIGAGAGGAVLAAELAEGGAKVVVLEQGPEHRADDFTARPPQMLARLYRDGGQTVTLGNPPVALPLGRGIGGTTLVNSGTCFRTPAHVLERWRRENGPEPDELGLEGCLERGERTRPVN